MNKQPIEIVFMKLCFCSVCHEKTMPTNEVLQHLRSQHPAGTKANWKPLSKKHLAKYPQQAPVACEDKPDHIHTMFIC